MGFTATQLFCRVSEIVLRIGMLLRFVHYKDAF